jgi:hypothetical protein
MDNLSYNSQFLVKQLVLEDAATRCCLYNAQSPVAQKPTPAAAFIVHLRRIPANRQSISVDRRKQENRQVSLRRPE